MKILLSLMLFILINVANAQTIDSCVNDYSLFKKINNLENLILGNEDEIIFSNKNQTQYLWLFLSNGGEGEPREIRLTTKHNNKKYQSLNVEKFITNNGIELGMRHDAFLKKIKGKKFKKNIIKDIITYEEVIKYDEKLSFFNKRFMPSYYSTYKFKNNILVELKFGFEAP